MKTITIIGAGMMGSALCWPLTDNGNKVRLVGTHIDEYIIDSIQENRFHPTLKRDVPENVTAYYHTQIEEAVKGADIVVSGVSSFGVEWFAENAGPYLNADVPVIAVTKGLVATQNGDLQIIPDYINGLLPDSLKDKVSINAIAGPCISHELAARRHSCVYFCGREESILETLRQTFITDYYHVYVTTDFIGAEAGVAMKNAYAICINLAVGQYEEAGNDGLAHMYNPQAALFAQSMREMQQILDIMGGKRDALLQLSGTGDLYVTVFGGRNARLGRLLGRGFSYPEAREQLAGETLEGVEILTRIGKALTLLEGRGLAKQSDFPLLMHLFDIIHKGVEIDIPWKDFFSDILI